MNSPSLSSSDRFHQSANGVEEEKTSESHDKEEEEEGGIRGRGGRRKLRKRKEEEVEGASGSGKGRAGTGSGSNKDLPTRFKGFLVCRERERQRVREYSQGRRVSERSGGRALPASTHLSSRASRSSSVEEEEQEEGGEAEAGPRHHDDGAPPTFLHRAHCRAACKPMKSMHQAG